MTDLTSSDRLLGRTPPGGRPVRKDEIELLERGIYIESWLPERRSRRKPLLFVHGELGGSWVWERYLQHFAGRGWEGHALNLRNHFWSQTADPATLDIATYTEDVIAAMERLGPNVVAVGHGMGGLLVLKAIERAPVSAYVLIAPEPPEGAPRGRPAARRARRPGRLRALGARLGDPAREAHPRPPRPDARRRPADPAPARPEGVRVGPGAAPGPHRACRSIAPRCRTSRGWSSAAAWTRTCRSPRWSSVADWLDAAYEPFGAHSHYGLVLGEQSYLQVAETLRTFLEANRL